MKKIIITIILIALVSIFFIGDYSFTNEQSQNDLSVVVIKNINLSQTELDTAISIANEHIKNNSVKDLEYSIEVRQILDNWLYISILPFDNATDEAQLYMQKINDVWVVEAFGTAFPDLYEKHPEIFDESIFDESIKSYRDDRYSFEFMYPTYAQIVLDDKVVDSIVRTINLNMSTLPGLNPIITLKIMNTSLFPGEVKKITEPFGNTTANRYDFSVAGGDFVAYEIALKNNEYLYIEIDKAFVEDNFNEQFKGKELEELKRGAAMFRLIKESFVK